MDRLLVPLVSGNPREEWGATEEGIVVIGTPISGHSRHRGRLTRWIELTWRRRRMPPVTTATHATNRAPTTHPAKAWAKLMARAANAATEAIMC